ncbi:MAG: hypothetical protein MI750_11900 [Xanthomonadales bacterium]|nr:hypothetical protein [Xanthomonadales bacterium]
MNYSPKYRPHATAPSGRLVHLEYQSSVLADNPWQDSSLRQVSVYLPPNYDANGAAYPVLWDLAAYTNAGPGHINWKNHGENVAQRIDRLIREEKMPAALCVFPDCYTSLGGNQYVNSPAVGRYADYLVDELVPLIDREFNTIAEARGRSLFGKSSGGYGALYLACHFPGVWGAVAAHAPDVGFDRVYFPDFPKTCSVLAPFKDDFRDFIRAFWGRKQPKGHEFHAMMVLCLAATYDPNLEAPDQIQLPFSLDTCELDTEAWARWLRFDPLQMIHQHTNAFKQLNRFWLDVGNRDQYNIQFGSRQLSRELHQLGMEHHFEEFDGTHSGIDWRLDHSLPWLLNQD